MGFNVGDIVRKIGSVDVNGHFQKYKIVEIITDQCKVQYEPLVNPDVILTFHSDVLELVS